jgi:hypothetical protein
LGCRSGVLVDGLVHALRDLDLVADHGLRRRLRSHDTGEHAAEDAADADAATRVYVRDVAGTTTSASSGLERLGSKAQGVIDDAEFQRLKVQIVAARPVLA